MELLRHDENKGPNNYNEEYNQYKLTWQPRGATGLEYNYEMKEIFVELEYWIEEIAGKK
jgi:hypothetical protein